MTENSSPTWDDLVHMIAEIDGSDFDNVAIQYGDVSIRMSRGDLPAEPDAALIPPTPVSPSPAPPVSDAQSTASGPASSGPAAARPAPAEAASATAAAPGATATASAPRGSAVTSPMVGVFYRSPSPGAPPFVSEGDSVTAESTIGIIEVMKLMNPVSAGIAGTVSAFAVPDAQAVEFGQDLLYILPEAS